MTLDGTNRLPSDSTPTPSQFLRARRPELFSDSVQVAEPSLTRNELDLRLETLTSQRLEVEFEHFCRRLAEREICPNLLPQTGPTGGGDSKVDSETYPVSDSVARCWYHASAREASRERWAFAFSAKKKWRDKVKDDVRKIAETDRGYALIYFVTNQYVSDRARAEVEDQLTAEHGIPVRILDRTWILDRVFESDHLDLAVQTLKMDGHAYQTRRACGQHDVKRTSELEELERQIADMSRYEGVRYQLAQDCITAAILSRNLERPRHEVEGKFLRAKRIADQVGFHPQRLRVAYEMAWTAYWYYDDFASLAALYADVQDLAAGTSQVHDLELLSNLWTVLQVAVRSGGLDEEQSEIAPRTDFLREELSRLAADRERPSTALHAATLLVFMNLSIARATDGPVNEFLEELNVILREAAELLEYPFESTSQVVIEVGSAFTESAEYDRLLDTIVEISEARSSRSSAGKLLLKRGLQKLRHQRLYEAIDLLGRALQKLASHEDRAEQVAALGACGLAYDRAGLIWAARACYLLAANITISEFTARGELVPAALSCAKKLVWSEIQLGRVPHALCWVEVMDAFATQLMLKDEPLTHFQEERQSQDMCLGLLMLLAGQTDLKHVGFLPSVLESLGLEHSRMALLYSMGQQEVLRGDGSIPESEDDAAVDSFFREWATQSVRSDLPASPEFALGTSIKLSTFVLGCEVRVRAENNSVSESLSEIVLAGLESLLATGLDKRVCPYQSVVEIRVTPSEFAPPSPKFFVEDMPGGQRLVIRHQRSLAYGGPQQRELLSKWLWALIVKFISEFVAIEDPNAYFEGLFKNELAFGRMMTCLNTPVCAANILGAEARRDSEAWKGRSDGEPFELLRDLPWQEETAPHDEERQEPDASEERSDTETVSALFGIDNLRHRDVRVVSLTNVPLWDRAGWRAVAYTCAPGTNAVPVLGLVFENRAAARAIFQSWRAEIGERDRDERIKVSIIRGVDRRNPLNYSVVVGTNLNAVAKSFPVSHFFSGGRANRMEPRSDEHLKGFLDAYETTGEYILAPAIMAETLSDIEVLFDLGIHKADLDVQEAWQLEEHSAGIVALEPSDDPVIPADAVDPPILRVMERKRARSVE